MAQITEMRSRSGLAGQLEIFVKVVHDDWDVYRYRFVGSVYGAPGPVVMVDDQYRQTFVSDPSRFGDTFNADWVLRFFA